MAGVTLQETETLLRKYTLNFKANIKRFTTSTAKVMNSFASIRSYFTTTIHLNENHKLFKDNHGYLKEIIHTHNANKSL